MAERFLFRLQKGQENYSKIDCISEGLLVCLGLFH
jgi:hypothetical protein